MRRRLRCWLRLSHFDSVQARARALDCLSRFDSVRRMLGCTCAAKAARSSASFPDGALPNAYALMDAIHVGDIPAANKALQRTTALHCATAALVLARTPRSADLRASLQLLALQAEIDQTAQNGDP